MYHSLESKSRQLEDISRLETLLMQVHTMINSHVELQDQMMREVFKNQFYSLMVILNLVDNSVTRISIAVSLIEIPPIVFELNEVSLNP